MDASAVSANVPLGGFVADGQGVTEPEQLPLVKAPIAAEPIDAQLNEQGAERRSGRVLEIFRQELKFAMFAKLGIAHSGQRSIFDALKGSSSPDEVAAEAVGAASRFAGENADVSSYALLKFRQRVQAAAAFTQQTVGTDDDIDDLDDAVARVSAGLDSLDEAASRNVESSASVLTVNSQLRQRSTIRIRTQEGDIVRLDVKRSNRLSAKDVAVSNENGSASRTEVSVSSRSRLTLSVKGDLNDAEFAAIQNVFAQAEAIADEFFGGDLSVAFSLASGLEFDTEQLNRVNLRFRSREVTTTTYSETRQSAPRPALELRPVPLPGDPKTPSEPPMTRPVLPITPPSTPEAVTKPDPEIATTQPVSVAAPATQPATQPAIEQSIESSLARRHADLGDASFLRFFDLLADFLRGVAAGFERATERAVEQETSALRFHYSQSFKLEIFKSVLQLSAPDESSDDSTELAISLIDGIVASAEAEGDDD